MNKTLPITGSFQFLTVFILSFLIIRRFPNPIRETVDNLNILSVIRLEDTRKSASLVDVKIGSLLTKELSWESQLNLAQVCFEIGENSCSSTLAAHFLAEMPDETLSGFDDGRNVYLYYFLGRYVLNEGDIHLAEELLEYVPGYAVFAKGMVASLEDKRILHSKVYFSLLFERMDDTSDALVEIGPALCEAVEVFYEAGEQELLRQLLQASNDRVETSVHFAKLLMCTGDLWRRDGQPEEASDFYQAAIHADHAYLPAQIMLAVIMREQNQFAVAHELLSSVISTKNRPDWQAWAYFEQSLVFFHQGDNLSAVCNAYQATRLMPEIKSYRNRLETYKVMSCDNSSYEHCFLDDWRICDK